MKRLHWILLLMILLIPTESISAKKKTEKSDREIWCDVMYRMAAPVLSNMSEGLLKQNMLVELSPTWDGRNQNVTYMECFGRLMAGLAPWLSLPDDDTPGRTSTQTTAGMGIEKLRSCSRSRFPPIICYGVRRIRPWWMPPSWQKVS